MKLYNMCSNLTLYGEWWGGGGHDQQCSSGVRLVQMRGCQTLCHTMQPGLAGWILAQENWLYVILCSLGLQAGFWPKKTELISDSADWERRGKCDMFSRFMLSMQTRISENQTKRHWWNGDLKKGIKYLKSGKVITSCFVAFRKLKSMIFQCQRGKKG